MTDAFSRGRGIESAERRPGCGEEKVGCAVVILHKRMRAENFFVLRGHYAGRAWYPVLRGIIVFARQGGSLWGVFLK